MSSPPSCLTERHGLHATGRAADDHMQGGHGEAASGARSVGPELAAKGSVGDDIASGGAMEASRLLEGSAAEWSSEGEDDRRHPDSLRTQLKRIFAEALSSEGGPVDALCLKMARTLRIRATKCLPLACPSSAQPAAPCEDVGAYCAAEEMPDGPMPAPDACVPPPPVPEAPRAPRVSRGDSHTGFACRHCGHTFAMRKTRDMHSKVCGAG